MKIEKYLLYLNKANKMAGQRLSVTPLTPVQLTILHLIRIHAPVRSVTLCSILIPDLCAHPRYVEFSLKGLRESGLIIHEGVTYRLSHTGREYIHLVRRYLLHKRIK